MRFSGIKHNSPQCSDCITKPGSITKLGWITTHKTAILLQCVEWTRLDGRFGIKQEAILSGLIMVLQYGAELLGCYTSGMQL